MFCLAGLSLIHSFNAELIESFACAVASIGFTAMAVITLRYIDITKRDCVLGYYTSDEIKKICKKRGEKWAKR